MPLFLFIAFTFCSSTTFSSYSDVEGVIELSDEVSMKSKLSEKGDQLLIVLELPDEDTIAFELYDKQRNILHRWDEENLEKGIQHLKLPIPKLEKDTYVIEMVGEKYELMQLLFIK